MRKVVGDLPSYSVPLLTLALGITTGVLIFVLFAKNPSGLTIEILAAIIAVVLVVASVCITVHYQHISDMKREFNVQLFERKIALYSEFIKTVAYADDDDEVTKDEMVRILNSARDVTLVGNLELVETMGQFIEEVINTRTILVSDENREHQFSKVVQLMREDLDVVDELNSSAQDLIRKLMVLAPQIHANSN